MKRAFEVKQKTLSLISQVISFRYTKQISKNVAEATFKAMIQHLIKVFSSFLQPLWVRMGAKWNIYLSFYQAKFESKF